MGEEDLILQLRSGNETAFRNLVHLYGDQVFNTSLSLMQNTEDAEDISQEVFIEVFRSIKEFRGDAKLSTWIYRITVAKSLEMIRKRKQKKRFAFITSLFSEGSEIKKGMDLPHFDHPGVLLENKENAAVLFMAIDSLPENQRTAFILHKVEGISYAEIAGIMKLSLSSVESLMFRARQNLQKVLKGFYEKNKD